MGTIKDRILIVENKPEISEFLAEQALASSNYQVFRVADAGTAISKTKQINPDLIIANLNLPGLSGRDLLVALSTHGLKPPTIMIAKEGQETEIIQAFRLGAADYLIWPFRETEIVLVVERLLEQVRLNRENKHLVDQLTISNQQLQQRVNELSTVFSAGKVLISLRDSKALFEKSLQIAAQICYADLGWFILRQDEKARNFILVAQHNLPEVFTKKNNSIWEDGISSLVAVSGETLSIAGDPLKRFNVKIFGNSIIIVPVKFQHQTIALLVLMRKDNKPFTKSEQRLLEAIAEYISISIENNNILKSLVTRTKSLSNLTDYTQNNEKIILELINKTETNILAFSNNINQNWNVIKERIDLKSDNEIIPAVENLELNIKNTKDLISILSKDPYLTNPSTGKDFNLIPVVQELKEIFLPIIKCNNIKLELDIPSSPLIIKADQHQIYSILQGIITNSIQFCDPEGVIRIIIVPGEKPEIKLTICNNGKINENTYDQSDSKQFFLTKQEKKRFAGIGISFQLIQELVHKNNSRIWIEENSMDGVCYHLLLPTS